MASGYFCLIALCCCMRGVSLPAFAMIAWVIVRAGKNKGSTVSTAGQNGEKSSAYGQFRIVPVWSE